MNSPLKPDAFAAASGVIDVNGEPHMIDGKGHKVPLRLVKDTAKLEDQTVRKVLAFARDLSAQVARFKQHTFADIEAFMELLAGQYGSKRGGDKGNLTLTSYDGLLKVQLQRADLTVFGPELQIAKGLVDECLAEWSEGSRDEIKLLVQSAFQTDKEGKVDRAAIFKLINIEIDDPRWREAMKAVKDSLKVVGSKPYVRFYERASLDADWRPITVDIASA